MFEAHRREQADRARQLQRARPATLQLRGLHQPPGGGGQVAVAEREQAPRLQRQAQQPGRRGAACIGFALVEPAEGLVAAVAGGCAQPDLDAQGQGPGLQPVRPRQGHRFAPMGSRRQALDLARRGRAGPLLQRRHLGRQRCRRSAAGQCAQCLAQGDGLRQALLDDAAQPPQPGRNGLGLGLQHDLESQLRGMPGALVETLDTPRVGLQHQGVARQRP